MRQLTQHQRVKAALLASARPQRVRAVLQWLDELDQTDGTAHAIAAQVLVIFEGNVRWAASRVRRAKLERDWVRREYQDWPHHKAVATWPALLISHLLRERGTGEVVQP